MVRQLIVTSIVVTLMLQGCTTTDPDSSPKTEPPAPPPLRPVAAVVNIGGSTQTVTLTPAASNDTVGQVGIGTYARTTLLRVIADGGIAPYYNFGPLPPLGNKGLPTGASYSPLGFNLSGKCQANAELRFTLAGSFGFCAGVTDLDVAVQVRGTGDVFWNPGPREKHLPDCNKTGSPSCYLYPGGTSFTVEVQKVAAEVTYLPDTAIVFLGDTVTFTASISPASVDGVAMPFDVPAYWQFQPDTGSVISACIPTAVVCQYVPLHTGTMSVSVIAQGDSLRFSSRVIVNNPLRLTCTPGSLPRGENVSCVTTTVDGRAFTLSEYRFTPTDTLLSAVAVSAPASVTWAGTGVTPGTVKATATILGGTVFATTSLGVNARSWTWVGSRWSLSQDSIPVICTYPDFTTSDSLRLGVNHRTGTCTDDLETRIDPKPSTDSGYVVLPVPTGPNTGMWYVDTVFYRMDRTTEINPDVRAGAPADTVVSPLTGACPSAPMLKNFFDYHTTCQSVNLSAFMTGLLQHEAFGSNNNTTDSTLANGHEARARFFASLPKNDPYTLAESVVAGDSAAMVAVIFSRINVANYTIHIGAGNHAFVNGNFGTTPPNCGTVWRITLATKTFTFDTLKQNIGGGVMKCI